jgi:signal transduction histidine kinase
MRQLPIVRGQEAHGREAGVVAPLAPATAEALAVALLADCLAARERALAHALASDADFSAWSSLQAAESVDFVATSADGVAANDELAHWLAPRLEDLLDWGSEAGQGGAVEAGRSADEANSGSAVARLLPPLAARLRRLKQVETRFDETLEAEKLEAMAEFAAGAGHEINNPLAVISGRAQLFLRHETDPERRRELAVMNSQARRVYEMIADMMLFARPPRPRPEACDVSAILDRLIADYASKAAERGVVLVRTGPSTPLVIQADPTQLIVALRAVCDNALNVLEGGGRIEAAARADGDWVEVTIRDDGPGIPPEVRQHLFDPFYSGRASGRGLGLGLSKCWRIVTNHGGSVVVDGAASPSVGGQGAAFTIRLPRVNA